MVPAAFSAVTVPFFPVPAVTASVVTRVTVDLSEDTEAMV